MTSEIILLACSFVVLMVILQGKSSWLLLGALPFLWLHPILYWIATSLFFLYKKQRWLLLYCLLQIPFAFWLTMRWPLVGLLVVSHYLLIGHHLTPKLQAIHFSLMVCLVGLIALTTNTSRLLAICALLASLCLSAQLIHYLFQETDMVYARSLDQIMANYVNEIDHLYENIRGWRHDYHNHLQALRSTVTANKQQETLSYLTDLEDHLATIDDIVRSGHTMLDAVVNSKLTMAQEYQIPLNVKVFVGTQPLINDVDLVVILGNILDNAIEANLEIPQPEQRLLRVYISILKQQLYISVTNARRLDQEIQIDFASTKNDKRGLGIRRINALVKKYDGLINRQYEEGYFVTELMLPLATITPQAEKRTLQE